MYSNTLIHLERFKNLEKGFFVKQYGYCSRSEQRLFVQTACVHYKLIRVVHMSGAPCVFDGKTCAP